MTRPSLEFRLLRDDQKEVATQGLLNIVSAPHLAAGSTYAALEPQLSRPRTGKESWQAKIRSEDKIEIQQKLASKSVVSSIDRTPAMTLAQFPVSVGSHWSNGQPRMSIRQKLTYDVSTGIQLLLPQVGVTELQDVLLRSSEAMWHEEEQKRSNAFFKGRTSNMADVKPGIQSAILIFSSRDGEDVYQFPWYNMYAPLIEPLLMQVGGAVSPHPFRLRPRDYGTLRNRCTYEQEKQLLRQGTGFKAPQTKA